MQLGRTSRSLLTWSLVATAAFALTGLAVVYTSSGASAAPGGTSWPPCWGGAIGRRSSGRSAAST